MKNKVDVAIVGAGMAGAATAWALAARGADIALIGPGEPADFASHRGIFASHYDEGRITRIADRDPVWADLAARSIARYKELEAATGIQFYTPAGLLILGPTGGAYLRVTAQTAQRYGGTLEALNGSDISQRYAALTCPADRSGLLEATPAGHVNPRRLVQALKNASAQAGGALIEQAVVALERQAGGVLLSMGDGSTLAAGRVLLASGAFTIEPALVPNLPWLEVQGRTIVMFEVAEDDAAIRALPSVVHMVRENADHETLYAVPPVRYPDGKLYLKAGTGLVKTTLKTTGDEERGQIGNWFRGNGNPAEIDMIKQELTRIVPALAGAPTRTAPCAFTYTKTERPYIAMLDERIGIVLGCNGIAAKSCIAIGEHAAAMVEGKLPEDLRAAFALPGSERRGGV